MTDATGFADVRMVVKISAANKPKHLIDVVSGDTSCLSNLRYEPPEVLRRAFQQLLIRPLLLKRYAASFNPTGMPALAQSPTR